MSGRVFISCGQNTKAERDAAAGLKGWFSGRGFRPHVAIQAQSLADINSGVVGELKRSDFYVFVDFRRERIASPPSTKRRTFRGSLFTNQELAIAFLLGFNHVIFLQQEGVELGGLLKFMGANPTRFKKVDEVLTLVPMLVQERNWSPAYSRHLALGELRWSIPIVFGDHTGQRPIRALYLDIHNRREDVAALDAVCRLESLRLPDGTVRTDIDRSAIKTNGQQGFAQPIWPGSHAAWDILSLSLNQPATVYLNSALDVNPRAPLITEPGNYVLSYEMFAQGFEVLKFAVGLRVSGETSETAATLIKPNRSGQILARDNSGTVGDISA
jgi:hypothetical protein